MRTVTLKVAPDGGRAQAQMYTGGGIPKIELTSTSTGYELHRLDVTMNIGGRGEVASRRAPPELPG